MTTDEGPFSRSESLPIPDVQLRTTSVLAEMRVDFPKGVRRFLSVTVRGAFAPDGKTLASMDAFGAIKLFDFPRVVPPALRGRSVAFSKDGATLLTSSLTGPSSLWNMSTGESRPWPGFPPELERCERSFSADFSKVAVLTLDGTVQLWDLETRVHRLLPQPPDQPAKRIMLSPDGKTLALGRDSRVQLWDVESCAGPATLDVYQNQTAASRWPFLPTASISSRCMRRSR